MLSTASSPVAIWHQLSQGSAKITLRGALTIHSLDYLWSDIQKSQEKWLKLGPSSAELVVDAAEVSYMDGTGVAFLIDLRNRQEAHGGTFRITNLKEQFSGLLTPFDPIQKLFPETEKIPKDAFVIRVGKTTQFAFDGFYDFMVYLGKVVAGLQWAIIHPRQVRWGDFARTAVEAGVAALPIIGLVSFLIGVILAFQSAIGLKQFGAETFVAPLVSLGIFRELGPLITAILLAGRSSAAFAAEIGTMTVNNEVDALVTAGFNPMRFLVIPRVLAGSLVAPILTMVSDVISVFAICITMTAYKIPLVTSYKGLLDTIHLDDIYSGLLKSILFGIVVSAIGCMRGMQTGTGASAVGISTTRAVVSSIVMIVVVDGIFAYISYKTGF